MTIKVWKNIDKKLKIILILLLKIFVYYLVGNDAKLKKLLEYGNFCSVEILSKIDGTDDRKI